MRISVNRRMEIVWFTFSRSAHFPPARLQFQPLDLHRVVLSSALFLSRAHLSSVVGSSSNRPLRSAVRSLFNGLDQLGRSDHACEPLDLHPTVLIVFNRNSRILIGRPILIGPFGPSTVTIKSRPSISNPAVKNLDPMFVGLARPP